MPFSNEKVAIKPKHDRQANAADWWCGMYYTYTPAFSASFVHA
ncbi:hypothetical protein VDP97_09330 [Xanthomonas campestris pv. campestris]|nr:hypothetical protein [Xanthomonas campestris]MDM7586132.1 hypothetical protein [Xanthomonas campestris]MDM7592012.1 hypothetical protein [Xanthomonas campestris]MDM7595901.1 hypothetical protein [Xanthomonas campestris pv. campestris]MDM7600006.1 hypothetical protein [Xanthomonas campestris pv. campestris]MDM7604061.1 hypothetical protein [Xanthomonas campestris pv. campestris]